jgi:HEAT repeat protein
LVLCGTLIPVWGCGYEDEHAALLEPPTPSVPISKELSADRKQIVEQLYSEDPRARADAAEALGKKAGGASDVVPYLTDALNDPVLFVREKAAEALVRCHPPEALDALVAKVAQEQEDWAVRERAVEALGEIGDPESLPVILERQTDMSAHVRMAVAEALGKIGGKEAVAVLREMAEGDADQRVRGVAREALAEATAP